MKFILFLFCTLLATQILFAQSNSGSSINNQTTPLDRNYMVSIGGNLSAADDGTVLGANVKFDHIQNSKLGIGIKTIAGVTTKSINSNADYILTFQPSLCLLSDLTLTYYFLGDYFNRKKGLYTADTHIYPKQFKMYVDFGLGYQCYKLKSSTNWKIYNNDNEKDVSTLTGLGAHMSLGATHRIGEGKIYLELMAGRILYGVDKKDVVSQSPNPTLIRYSTKHTGSFPSQNDIDFLGINLGYCYYF